MKKNILLILSSIVILVLSSCGTQQIAVSPNVEETIANKQVQTEGQKEQKTITVTSSIIPIGSVINAIGWDYVDVNTIIPAWVSPHGFDLSAKDLVVIEKSDISFIIGLEQIDGFLKKSLTNKKHIKLSEGMNLIEVESHDHDAYSDEHWDEHEDEEKHSDDEYSDEEGHEDEHSVDPHVWLGKENIFSISEKIRDQLSLIIPEHSDYFAENTKIFLREVELVYKDFVEKNAEKTAREFIVFHDAYNYLMESLNIESNLKLPFSENVLHEAGTAHMAELIDEVELHGIKNIFSEPQFSAWTLQKFVEEYDLTLGTLDPLGTDDSATWYLKNLKSNLDNISKIYD